jgi:hypothetical protein
MKREFWSKVTATAALAMVGATMLPAQPPPPEAQSQSQPPSPGWRRFNEPRAAQPPRDVEAPPPPVDDREEPIPAQPPAPTITLPAGAFLTVRVNQPLSSDQNLAGDTVTATLTQPLVADGYVVARRGQTIAGRVADVVKAGRIKGTSRLGLELVEISLVDGQQLPVRTQLIEYHGGTSMGRDATAVGTATGVGAAIGAAADGGFGAGMGAIAGAAASTIGVLATRGRATVVYPEAELTFRIMSPMTINTERSQHAFHPVRQGDYEQRTLQRRTAMRPVQPYPPMWYGGGYGYGGWGPYFWGGPRVMFYSGPRFYGRGWRRW